MPRSCLPRPLVLLLLATIIATGASASCEVAPDGATSEPSDPPSNKDSAAMKGFSWVIPNEVAGMPRPGGSRPLEQDVAFLQAQGIDFLVSLTEKPTDIDLLGHHGIRLLHIPVPDFHAPTQEQLDEYVESVNGWTRAGAQVGTHCGAGLGRTGTFLAALFVSRRMSAEGAIAEVRRLRPGSIETEAQEKAVYEFAARHASPAP